MEAIAGAGAAGIAIGSGADGCAAARAPSKLGGIADAIGAGEGGFRLAICCPAFGCRGWFGGVIEGMTLCAFSGLDAQIWNPRAGDGGGGGANGLGRPIAAICCGSMGGTIGFAIYPAFRIEPTPDMTLPAAPPSPAIVPSVAPRPLCTCWLAVPYKLA